jgi:predicted transcriptional regulator
MKTTVEITDSLLERAKRLASQEHTTVRALVEEGLRRIFAERRRANPFKLRKASFKGKGLQPQMAGASWPGIRDASYEGRLAEHIQAGLRQADVGLGRGHDQVLAKWRRRAQ